MIPVGPARVSKDLVGPGNKTKRRDTVDCRPVPPRSFRPCLLSRCPHAPCRENENASPNRSRSPQEQPADNKDTRRTVTETWGNPALHGRTGGNRAVYERHHDSCKQKQGSCPSRRAHHDAARPREDGLPYGIHFPCIHARLSRWYIYTTDDCLEGCSQRLRGQEASAYPEVS